MKKIAFFAPLKSPNHTVPSGDREMARALMAALHGNDVDVQLVSELRLRDGDGNPQRQSELRDAARSEAEDLIAHADWDIWVTYHNYYKAPDLLGPVVCKALGTPYVLIEATRASKRLKGPWALFAEAAELACDQADLIFYLTERDKMALAEHCPGHQRLVHLPPFLPHDNVSDERKQPDNSIIFAAGMMRPGDKIESYREIAAMLPYLQTPDWSLKIAGDGAARASVDAMFAPFSDRVQFLGRCDPDEMQNHYLTSSVFVWPGVNEAFGMVYLEAQANGTPVIAQNRAGVRDVVPVSGLVPVSDPKCMAAAIDDLLQNPSRWRTASEEGRRKISRRHLKRSAGQTLLHAIAPLIGKPA